MWILGLTFHPLLHGVYVSIYKCKNLSLRDDTSLIGRRNGLIRLEFRPIAVFAGDWSTSSAFNRSVRALMMIFYVALYERRRVLSWRGSYGAAPWDVRGPAPRVGSASSGWLIINAIVGCYCSRCAFLQVLSAAQLICLSGAGQSIGGDA
jgi:hypothetical protein